MNTNQQIHKSLIANARTHGRAYTTDEWKAAQQHVMKGRTPEAAANLVLPKKVKANAAAEAKRRQGNEPLRVKRSANGIWMVDEGKGFKFAKATHPAVIAHLGKKTATRKATGKKTADADVLDAANTAFMERLAELEGQIKAICEHFGI